MRTAFLLQEILKPRHIFPNTIPYKARVFSDLLLILNNLNHETNPESSPTYQIHKGILKCTSNGQSQNVCRIDAIESYVITPMGIRIFDKDPGREYVLALNPRKD